MRKSLRRTHKLQKSKKTLLLLDRDGTLIEDGDYLGDPKRVRLLPGVTTALRRLKRAGFYLVVVSNQSGVGRGLISLNQLKRVNRRFLELLKKKKASVDALYFCPHSPSTHCSCRKPKLGMVRRAAKDIGIPWKNSISVGDRPSDVKIGQRTGGAGILVLTGYGRQWTGKKEAVRPDYTAVDFNQAANWIIRHHA